MNKYEDDLRHIINNYSKLLYKITYDFIHDKVETENIVQDSFLSYYKNVETYSLLSNEEKKRLLARIAINKSKDYLKSLQNKMKCDTNDQVINNIISNFEIEDYLVKQERKKNIVKAINYLKEPYKSLIKKYYMEDYTLNELAEINKTSKNTIKVQIDRAKKKLKELLLKGGELND